jgi:DNA-binding NarL/FixJ family response regulator
MRLMMSDAPRFHVVGEASDRGDVPAAGQGIPARRADHGFQHARRWPAAVKAARELQPALHIIVFSGRHDARTRDATLDAGTKQYVVKTGRLRPLIEARDRAFTPTTGVLPA